MSEPAALRLAATVLLGRDDPFEVLMIKRNEKQHFASALVFPGGAVDADDAAEAWLGRVSGAEGLSAHERALRIAACRELYEEVGVVAAEVQARSAGPAKGASFADALAALGVTLSLQQLQPFGHWITPEGVPKRYDTHFFLCPAPAGAAPVCDGEEAVSMEWIAPREAFRQGDEGERAVLFPTRMNLKRLAESNDVAGALAAAAARPKFTVTPKFERRETGTIVVIPAEAGYGVTEDFGGAKPRKT